jgi:hypothetical protein
MGVFSVRRWSTSATGATGVHRAYTCWHRDQNAFDGLSPCDQEPKCPIDDRLLELDRYVLCLVARQLDQDHRAFGCRGAALAHRTQ